MSILFKDLTPLLWYELAIVLFLLKLITIKAEQTQCCTRLKSFYAVVLFTILQLSSR